MDRWRWSRSAIRCWCSLPAARSRKACWRSPRICANAVRRYCSLPRTTSPRRDLPLQRAAHPALDPILAIQSFYVMAAGLAEARGMDPDQPRHLSKVTRTH